MLVPNTVLQNRYRVIRELGHGGMGTVYEVLDQRVSCIVALKETSAGNNSEARDAFEREAALLANLRHSALPKVMDYFSEGGGDFLVMEFIPGYDLSELLELRGGAFPQAQVLRWADALLQVLEYLHKQQPPILHRDIKPSNLKLTKQGEIFLLDFGLAKGAAGQMRTLMTSRSVKGYTPVYASIEQILGQGTDPRSDLYSLAATLHHLLTALPPKDAPMRFDALEDEQPDPLPSIEEVNPQVSANVAAVIRRSMAINRRQRPTSAVEMRKALRSAIEEDERYSAEEEYRRAEVRGQQRDDERRKAVTDAEREEEERQKLAAETRRKEVALRFAAEAEARRQADEDAARQVEEETRRRVAEQELRKSAEHEARRRAKQEWLRLAAEEQRRYEEEAHRRAAEVETRQRAELALAQSKADQEAVRLREEQACTQGETDSERGAEERRQASGRIFAGPAVESLRNRSPVRSVNDDQSSLPVSSVFAIGSETKSVAPKRSRRMIAAVVGVLAVILVGGFVYEFVPRLFPHDSPAIDGQSPGNKQGDTGSPGDTGSGSDGASTTDGSKMGNVKDMAVPKGMVYVPGGTFTMGRNDGDDYEKPAHTVTVQPFFIDVYEVTCEEYKKFLDERPKQPAPDGWNRRDYPAGAARKPVAGVTWYDATAYAEWASKRLPTEEEWEFAARGTDHRIYPWGENWQPGQANTGKREAGPDDGGTGMVEVGTYKGKSPFGTYDMVGNAWEWTASTLKAYRGGSLGSLDLSRDQKVLRGGSWASQSDRATTTFRRGYAPRGEKRGYSYTGFRLVKDAADSGS